ncbi:MAG TPA: response regulator [Planctomycetaceae bacterium]|nr:response regulator [Planctomycetaceae bacterium]
MAQLLILERDRSRREAFVDLFEEAGYSVFATPETTAAVTLLHDATLQAAVIGEHDDDAALRTALEQTSAPKIVLTAPGDFRKLIAALCLGATEIVSADRPPRDLVATVQAVLAHRDTTSVPIHAEGEELCVELDGHSARLHVTTERLLALLAQVCEDASRLKRRYEIELAHRRRVEEALLQSEAFYQSLVETLPLALFRKDLQGRIDFANRLLCDALRRPVDEVIGKTDYDFFPEELAEKYRADDRRVIETQTDFETIEEFQTPSGERRFTHVMKTPAYNASGELTGILGVFSDVTDRVRTENALEQERYLLDNLMQSSPDNIYFKDANGRYLRINPAKATSSGLTGPAEAIGKSDADFFGPEHQRTATADEQQVMLTGEPLIGKEEHNVYPDGRVRWMSTTKMPLRDRQGNIVGTFGVSRDITALKLAQEALSAAAATADAANRAKSDFLANMSHEIRTPLNAVLGMTELVLDTPLTPVQRDYLKLVQESGESLLTVINDILDFSKIEAGKLAIEETPFEVREFLGDTLKSMGLRAHRKGLELIAEIAPTVPTMLVGDPHRLRQVLVNLVGNAIKFTDQGEILLNVEPETSNGDGVTLHFQVRDTGIGIPTEKFSTIFEAFEQADRSTTRRFGGTGLGLAISTRLVALMGGRIWVESELGRGSTFHFTVVFQPCDAGERCPPASPELLQGLRVLVVDDNSTNRRILAEMLTSWGMTPVLVSDADAALAELQKGQEYGLVLTDVHMPGQSGFDLVRRARESDIYVKGVVLMLTSGDRADDLETCRELGVSTYLIKPVKQSELFNAILQALGEAHHEQWSTAATSQVKEAARSLNVLLAEDSVINQKLAIGLLDRWGHRVTVANDGREAVERSKEQEFDVILMDIQMPELDGLDATREIRAREAVDGQHTPIVAMTAHALQGDRERCLAAGMDDYLTKPIRFEQLFECLERIGQQTPTATVARNAVVIPPPFEDDDEAIHLVSPVETTSLVNWKRARSAAAHDPELLADVSRAFLEESPQLADRALREFAAGDWKALQRTMHTLKNSFATFGVEEGQARAADIERGCRAGDPPVSTQPLEEVRAIVDSVAKELTASLQTPS